MRFTKKCSIFGLAVILTLLTGKGKAQELTLLKTTALPHYPSASALEMISDRLYLVGDDAPQLLILDGEHRIIDRVTLFSGTDKRISREEKTDLESLVALSQDGKTFLLGIGSFSAKPRERVLSLQLTGGPSSKLVAWTVNGRPRKRQVKEMNIEGAALVNRHLLLANRAHLKQPVNHLIIASVQSNGGVNLKKSKVIRVNLPASQAVTGLSGLAYVAEKDLLLFTATTEQTSSTTADGAIGDSYIGFISHFSARLRQKSVQADRLLNLTPVLRQSEPQKIEGIAVEAVSGQTLTIHLAADNDNGKSNLFKVKLAL